MSKEEALKLCIDGVKVTTQSHPCSYIYFNGNNFVYHNGMSGNDEVVNYDLNAEQWYLWEEPKPIPKFSIGSFAIDEDGDYVRIVSMEYKNGSWKYKAVIRPNGIHHTSDESKLSAVS